jgi:hypothetical protein
MSQISALDKHACPACGARAEWHPARQLLVCPYCGTLVPHDFEKDTGQIHELDLATALRALPDEQRGWQTERRSVQCQSCRAVMVYDPARVGQNCEFCGSPALVPYSEIRAPIRPQSLLPFVVSHTTVREQIRGWFGSQWFAPNALTRRALVDQVHGIYIPYWTFDARVHCPWEAEAGHHYYVAEEFRDSQGKRQVRQVRRTRWEWAAGAIDHVFDDQPVPGTRGLPLTLLTAVEPFPTKELVPYDTGYLSGYVVEHYQVVLFEAAKRSEDTMHARLTELCAAEVPGDTYRNLRIRPTYSGRTFKHVLVPVWMLTYTYGRKTHQVVVNGYTGRMSGTYPKSAWKIALTALLVLLLVLIVVILSQR